MKSFKLVSWVKMYVQGMMMGIADLIPGVSGGTVAFITGLHPKLLTSLKTLRLSSLRNPKKIAWFNLTAIAMGMVTTIALGSHAIYQLLNHNLYQSLLRALFMGLILGSVYFCIKQIEMWTFKRSLALILGVAVAFSVSYFCNRYSSQPLYDVPLEIEAPQQVLQQVGNYDYQKKLLKKVNWSNLRTLYQEDFIEADAWIFSHDYQRYLQVETCLERNLHFGYYSKLGLCGALSIGAMILPGISGNQVMQMMGCYETVIEAIALWTKGIFSGYIINPAFWVLFSMGLGILIGVATFSRVLIYFYQRYFQVTLSLLVGFMMGSLTNLWPFWKTNYHIALTKTGYQLSLQRLEPTLPSLISMQTIGCLLMTALGLSIVVALEKKLSFKKLQFEQS